MKIITLAIIILFGKCVLADDCLLEVVRDPVHQFKSQTSHIPVTEISDVISLSLGLATEPVSYSGLQRSDIFHRPSATLTLVWEVMPGTIETCSLSQHEGVNFRTTRDYLLSEFDEEGPVIVDYASSIKLTKTPRRLNNALSKIPSTLDGMQTILNREDSIFYTEDVGSLNITKPTVLNFFSELQLIKEVFDKVSQNSESAVDGTPDLYTFVLSGLRAIQEEYGSDSVQSKDASKLMKEFLSETYKKVDGLYNDNILITLVKVEKEKSVRRMIRSATDPTEIPVIPTTDYNLAPFYSNDFPVMFNIILWLVVIIALALYTSSYMLASMDPGDTIIYRMTSQRIKME